MQVATLMEKLWDKLNEWLEVFVVMLPNLAAAILVVVLFSLVSKWVGKGVRKVLVRVTDNKPISDILGALVRVAVVILGVLFALGLLELDKTVTSVLAGVGVLGLALGLAFQDIAANFMSGFLMAIKRPIDVGDLVEVAGKKGRVDRVELRATVLTTLDGLSVIVPNKQVYQAPIVNYTRTRDRRMSIDVGVAYNSPLRKVTRPGLRRRTRSRIVPASSSALTVTSWARSTHCAASGWGASTSRSPGVTPSEIFRTWRPPPAA
jgi:small conductance mechanosensitive channel